MNKGSAGEIRLTVTQSKSCKRVSRMQQQQMNRARSKIGNKDNHRRILFIVLANSFRRHVTLKASQRPSAESLICTCHSQVAAIHYKDARWPHATSIFASFRKLNRIRKNKASTVCCTLFAANSAPLCAYNVTLGQMHRMRHAISRMRP